MVPSTWDTHAPSAGPATPSGGRNKRIHRFQLPRHSSRFAHVSRRKIQSSNSSLTAGRRSSQWETTDNGQYANRTTTVTVKPAMRLTTSDQRCRCGNMNASRMFQILRQMQIDDETMTNWVKRQSQTNAQIFECCSHRQSSTNYQLTNMAQTTNLASLKSDNNDYVTAYSTG